MFVSIGLQAARRRKSDAFALLVLAEFRGYELFSANAHQCNFHCMLTKNFAF